MLKKNLFFLFSVFLVGLASFFVSINNYNPYEANFYQFIFFYSSFLVTLTCLLAIVFFYIKVSYAKSEVVYSFFWPSARQGFIFSIGVTTLLVLKGIRLSDIWISVPVILIVILLELFFQTKKQK